ncbi:A1S_2505 family phage non-structural protein [Leptolyngbya sp. AN03gr2]|uniref:A1S_2505 family phage non-structural protein n=1 Tax=unclassified Leptolyngbya TaxID=2650499 RepID=UPI003D318299
MVLSFVQYDAKLLRPLEIVAKEVNHTLLEHLIEVEQQRVGNWETRYVTAQIYEGVTADDLRAFRELELQLILANGKWAYFTDAQTAALVQRQVARSSDAIAYGSLFLSHANASTVRSQGRILVLDDAATSEAIIAQLPKICQALGTNFSEIDLQNIHRKLGDCYSLVSSNLAHAVAYSSHQKQSKDPDRSPFQFRAGSLEILGVIKGTCRVSDWCDRLQVDAILSFSSFKATQQLNGEKLLLLGVHTVSNFFFANKTYAATSQQKRGLQPALVTPEATQQEVLPELVEKAIATAQVQATSQAAIDYYLSVAERKRNILDEIEDSEDIVEETYIDPVYEILKADQFQQMQGHPKVLDAIAKVLHHEWMDAVTVGVYSPSAIAQPHADLNPWECCFRELPHGALVSLYRSPLGNIAGIGTFINNTEQLRETDSEAFRQQGVIYLNSWSAANVLITDFDGDRNAIVLGYVAVSPGATVYSLQEQLREFSDPRSAYEAAQALFLTAVQDPKIFTPTESPIFVAEVLDKNRPEVRPISVNKEPKIERQGTIEECAVHAANNPTGIVANLSMKIDSLYWDIAYLAPEQRPAYLQQICSHYAKVLERTEIPQPEDYTAVLSSGDLQFRDRIRQIVDESRQLFQLREPDRIETAGLVLQEVQALLWDVKGIIAMNLQRAVDSPKSAREVAWHLQGFAAALGKYKQNLLLNHRKDTDLYQPLKPKEAVEAVRVLSTSTVDPVAQIAKQVNQHYQEVVLTPRSRDSFLPLFPNREQGGFSEIQAKTARSWIDDYNAVIQRGAIAQERAKTEVGPSLLIQSIGGRQLRVINLTACDSQGISPIWQAARQNTFLEVRVGLNPDWQTKTQFPYAIFLDSSKSVGLISTESVQANQAWLQQASIEKTLAISLDRIERFVFEPHMTIAQAKAEITEAVQKIARQAELLVPAERTSMAAALWHQGGQHLVIQAFHPELCQQIQSLHLQTMTVVGLQHPTNLHQGRAFSKELCKIAVAVETNSESLIAGRTVLQVEGKTLAPFSIDSYQLPIGTQGEARIVPEVPAIVKAILPNGTSIKINQVQAHHFANQVWSNETVELGIKRREREGSKWSDVVLTMRDSAGQLQDLGIVSTAKDRQAVEAAFRQVSPVLKRETTIAASLTSDIARLATVHLIPESLQLPNTNSPSREIQRTMMQSNNTPEQLYAQILKTEYVWSAEALSRYLKPSRSYDYIQYERIDRPDAPITQRLPMYFDGAMMTRITGIANSLSPQSSFTNTFDAIAAGYRTSTLRNHGQIRANIGDIVTIIGQPGQSLWAKITAIQTLTVPPTGINFSEIEAQPATLRSSPDRIESLQPHQVFVFGSNRQGRHGAGAAKQAMQFGAEYSNPQGIQGQTYAIVTKDLNLGARSVSLSEIEAQIGQLLNYARSHPNQEFLVTRIGCGLGGYHDHEIAALWSEKLIPENVRLPQSFIEVIQASYRDSEPLTRSNPLADLPALNPATARHMQKDVAMAEIATQFIGTSAAPVHTPSSTRNYEMAWGDRANTGRYDAADIVMVSGSGPWRSVSQTSIQQVFQTHYQPLLDQAIAAQAQFVVGNAAGTDQLVQQYLRSHGYRLEWNSIAASSGYLKATSPVHLAVPSSVESNQGACEKTIAGYCPSRGELLQWYQAYQLRAQTHLHDPQKLKQDQEGMAHVEAIRLRQKTEGLKQMQGQIPDVSNNAFRNPAVVLSAEEYKRMQKAILYLRQASPTHTQASRTCHSPSRT